VTSPPAGRPLNDGKQARKDVAKYLLPDEQAVVATRRHWASLVEPAAKALPVLVVGGWLLLLDPQNHATSAAGLLILVAGLVYLGLRVAEWWKRHFIVSPRRMLLTSGVIVRTVTLLPRRRITDLTWQGTFFGQILGYGTFRIESAGQHQALSRVTFLPHPDELYRTISQLLFPGDTIGLGDDGYGDNDDDGPARPLPPPGPQGGAPRAGERRDTEPIPGPPPP
jgi:membrane protein YdbS with pleckstrin-like domain